MKKLFYLFILLSVSGCATDNNVVNVEEPAALITEQEVVVSESEDPDIPEIKREISDLYPEQFLKDYAVKNGFERLDDVFKPGNVYYVKENPESGYYWPFKIYIPDEADLSSKNRLLVIPNNTGFRSDNFEDHIDRAWDDNRWPYIQIIPIFPRFETPENEEWLSPQYLYAANFTTERLEHYRVDLQLLAMMEQAGKELEIRNIDVYEKFFFWGYSASAIFSSSFIMLHPEVIEAAAMGGHYWNVIPLESYKGVDLPYGFGIKGYYELTGKPFDLASYKAIKQFIYMGSNDNPIGPLHFSLATIYGENKMHEYYPRILNKIGNNAEELFATFSNFYNEGDYPNITCVLYEGADHGEANNDYSTADVQEFFRGIE